MQAQHLSVFKGLKFHFEHGNYFFYYFLEKKCCNLIVFDSNIFNLFNCRCFLRTFEEMYIYTLHSSSPFRGRNF